VRKHALIAVLIFIVLSALTFGYTRRADLLTASAQSANKPLSSLREKAKRERTHVETSRPTNIPRYNELRKLVEDSQLIAVGVPEQQTSKMLSPKETFIITDVQVRVQNVIKGSLDSGNTLTVTVPGGRIQFEDKSTAEVKMPDFWKNPEIGKTYIFFLRKHDNERFKIIGGPQGLFEITPTATIQPQVLPEDLLMRKYKDKDVVSFIQEIQQAGDKQGARK
jgi:hypothetical protein